MFCIDLQQSIPCFEGIQMADRTHAKPRRCGAWLLPLWWQPWLCLPFCLGESFGKGSGRTLATVCPLRPCWHRFEPSPWLQMMPPCCPSLEICINLSLSALDRLITVLDQVGRLWRLSYHLDRLSRYPPVPARDAKSAAVEVYMRSRARSCIRRSTT